jgi:hypothetical protein
MFAARLLLGEFVTGHEVSGGVGTPVEVIDELTKRSKELLIATVLALRN